MVAGSTASTESLRERVEELERTAAELETRVLAYEEVFFGNPVPALVYATDANVHLFGRAILTEAQAIWLIVLAGWLRLAGKSGSGGGSCHVS